MRSLTDLDRETRAICLGARTTVAEPAATELRALVESGLDWDRMWDLGSRHDVLPLLAQSLPGAAAAAVPAETVRCSILRFIALISPISAPLR